MRFYTIIMIMMFTFTTNIFASSSDREHVMELEEKCLQAKNEILKDEKERKINTCIEVDKLEEEYCHRFFKDYGGGKYQPANLRNKLRELPECIEAFSARKNLKR